jgi:hypothetical protein
MLAALVASATATQAEATSTRCSNPQREGVRASGTVKLAWLDRAKLGVLLQGSNKALGMSYSWVESGLTGQPSNKKHFILQSPKVSVAIEVLALRSSDLAKVTVERTCINDSLEAWQPYWRRFRALMAAKGYPVRTSN